MKLVSSAKYARANRAILNSQPYYESFQEMIDLLSSSLMANDQGRVLSKKNSKSLLIIISTDRGLCGGLNSNLFKKCNSFIEEKEKEGSEIYLGLWGKRSIMYGQKKPHPTFMKEVKVLEKPSFKGAKEVARQISKKISSDDFSSVYVAYASFKNTLTQIPKIDQVLPLTSEGHEKRRTDEATRLKAENFIFEPSKKKLLKSALEIKIALNLFQIILNASASEHAARMAAMDNATNNADQVISTLTIQYNRARQAAITKELIEITSGAEAL